MTSPAGVGPRPMPPRPSSQIDVSKVTKRFPRPDDARSELVAVRDISFTVNEGQFISLIGASGCGKTTLLRMMSGLLPYDEGEIRLRGELVNGVPPAIGFVFQEPALLPWRTVRDNLTFALQHRDLSRSQTDALVDDKLRLTNLQDFAGYYPRMLSGGMQQRVGLARALVCDPSVLFMDEPLSALDAFTRRRLQQDIGQIIARLQATTVLVTHDVDEAIFMSDRIIVMGSSPGFIREALDVPLPRPRRHADLIGDSRVAELRDRVLALVLGTEESS
jgi:ABC-type nitrate/sulfonate/bicarbonate transport system ATPase subunit